MNSLVEIQNTVRSEVLKNGFFHSETDCSFDFHNFAKSLGQLVSPRFSDPQIQKLCFREKNESSNSLSSRYGHEAFPLHTDCAHHVIPPKLLCLYAPLEDETKTATKVIRLNLEQIKDEAVFLKSRIFSNGIKSIKSSIVCTAANNTPLIRFNEDCMLGTHTTDDEKAELRNRIWDNGQLFTFSWRKGSLLIIDNHLCLHGRGEKNFDGSRLLYRALVR